MTLWATAEAPRAKEAGGRATKVVIYEAFVDGKLEVPEHLARNVHDLHFVPKSDEFKPRTTWSVSNAFTSALKELDAIPRIIKRTPLKQ